MNTRILFISFLILVAALSRLIPHPLNFTAVAAVALFGGAKLQKAWLALVIPIAAMFISDAIIGFHGGMPVIYGCMIAITFIGRYMQNRQSAPAIVAGSLLSSALFFAVSNFAVWVGNPVHTQDFAGLVQCYTIAIPFFGNTIAGDLFYSGVLFGSYALAAKKVPALR